jgi:hypothetical protein
MRKVYIYSEITLEVHLKILLFFLSSSSALSPFLPYIFLLYLNPSTLFLLYWCWGNPGYWVKTERSFF